MIGRLSRSAYWALGPQGPHSRYRSVPLRISKLAACGDGSLIGSRWSRARFQLTHLGEHES
jgi:hypothetical protein